MNTHPKAKKQSDSPSNRIAERDELNFSDDEPTRSFRDLVPEGEEELGEDVPRHTHAKPLKAGMPGDEPTEDDLAPEILIKEDGARSSHERGSGRAMDQRLSIVDADEIGGGNGLDEAELAIINPLDGKPQK